MYYGEELNSLIEQKIREMYRSDVIAVVDTNYNGTGQPKLILPGKSDATSETFRAVNGLVLAAGDTVVVSYIGDEAFIAHKLG